MDTWILAFTGIVVLVAAVATTYVFAKRRAAGESPQWEDIGQVVRLVQDVLGNVFTDAEVDAAARLLYRRWKMASDLYTEDQWVDLLKKIFPAGKTRAVGQGQISQADVAELRSLVESMRTKE